MDPTEKVALITGGARVGRAIARIFAQRGAHLALAYRNSKQAAEESASYAASVGRKTFLIKADFTKRKSCAEVIAKIKVRFGRLDILVHLASVYSETSFASFKAETWDQNMDVHLRSACELARLAAPLMRKYGGGRIILFGDWTGASGRPRYKEFLPYYVSKSAAIGLTEALALELAPDILVNSIAPGPILPPTKMKSRERENVVKATPLRRWGGAEEIAKAVLFFVETDFVMGECLRVDGGRHLY